MTLHEPVSSGYEESVRDTFSRSTELYAARFREQPTAASFGFRQRLKVAVELTRGSAGHMLDCATGTGEITAAVLKHSEFTHATVVDISPEMLACSRAQIESGMRTRSTAHAFVLADIFRFLSTVTERYDVVLCLGLIAHTGRLAELLARLKPLLTPGARILLQTSLLDHPGTRIVRAFTGGRYYRQHGYRISYFHSRDVEDACRQNGLVILNRHRLSVGIPFGDWIWATGNHWVEQVAQRWAMRHGAEAIYVISTGATGM